MCVETGGHVYVAGFTDCCVAYRVNATVGGIAPGPYLYQSDPYTPNQSEGVLLGMPPSLDSRDFFNSWMQNGVVTLAGVHTSAGWGAVVGNVARGGGATLKNPLTGTPTKPSGPASFVAVWPLKETIIRNGALERPIAGASPILDKNTKRSDAKHHLKLEERLQTRASSLPDGEYTVWLQQAINNTGNGGHAYGHMQAVELHLHKSNGVWDPFVLGYAYFEWSYMAAYDYTWHNGTLSGIVDNDGDTFSATVDMSLNSDGTIAGAQGTYNFTFSISKQGKMETSCVHTACDPCKDAGKGSCPQSCSCQPSEGKPPPGVPGSFCGPCVSGTTLDVVGTFEGRYDDCDGTIFCPRGRNDLHFSGNHQRLSGNVTVSQWWPLHHDPWPAPVVPAPRASPVQPNEHPRLVMRKSDVPVVARRVDTPIGRAYMKRLDTVLR